MRRERLAEVKDTSAMERLKGFVKKPVDYHDAARMRRVKDGREHGPRGITWRELARAIHAC